MTYSHLVAKSILVKCKISSNNSLVFDHGLTNLLPHLINELMVFISYQILNVLPHTTILLHQTPKVGIHVN